jgi:MFS transporter, NRE family, putaive nickel resistance protein
MAFPITPIFQVLSNKAFARLYFAQAINLVGDAFTWLGLALLAVELAGKNAGGILAVALTLRVMSFVLLSPIAGSIADRFDRKQIMVITHLGRMVLVCGLPFVTQVWQLYGIVLLLNCCAAFFTPTYKACIPMLATDAEVPQAIALSSSTYQILGVLGPGLAGAFANLVGQRQVFFLDGLTFLLAALTILMLPGQLRINLENSSPRKLVQILQDIKLGTTPLLCDPALRYGLALQLVGAIGGAQILVNTVGYVQTTLKLGSVEYGWVMLAFGLGAALGSIAFSYLSRRKSTVLTSHFPAQYLTPATITGCGATIMTLALLPASGASFLGLIGLWLLAGLGQSWIDLPMQALVGTRVARELQGRVYGAHFAWSHLWWAIGYPMAGLVGQRSPLSTFMVGSLVGLGLLVVFHWWLWPRSLDQTGLWHEHEHEHEHRTGHAHAHNRETTELPHSHLHYHSIVDGHSRT